MFAGLGVGIAEFFAKTFLGKIAKGATGVLSAIPKPVWEAITVILYVLALLVLHQHYANAAIKAAHDQGYAEATAKIKAEEAKKTAIVVAATQAGNAQSAEVNRGVQKTYAQDHAGTISTADWLRRSYQQRGSVGVSGPGVSRVPVPTVEPTGALSGGQPENGRLDEGDPGAAGPTAGPGAGRDQAAQPTITVPALELLDRAVICDDDHAQVKAWWAWWRANDKIYQDWVKKVQAAAKP